MNNSIIFTAEAEKRRLLALKERRAALPRKATYELLSTSSLVEAIHFAKEHGWAQQKVQVKAFSDPHTEYLYTVEPFEVDCGCPNLLDYDDYFDGE